VVVYLNNEMKKYQGNVNDELKAEGFGVLVDKNATS
jgi:hypothetical protein